MRSHIVRSLSGLTRWRIARSSQRRESTVFGWLLQMRELSNRSLSRCSSNRTQAYAQFGCGDAVTFQAEGAHVGEVAFTSAFGYRQDVVGVP